MNLQKLSDKAHGSAVGVCQRAYANIPISLSQKMQIHINKNDRKATD